MTIPKIVTVTDANGLKKTYVYIIDVGKTEVDEEDYGSINVFLPQHLKEGLQAESLPTGDYTRMTYPDEETGQMRPVYVTTHLCQPDSVVEDFCTTAAVASRMKGEAQTSPIAYKFVQSFEDDEDLTDEQVHQIGLELVDKAFPEFPYVVASHVHPVEGKDGVVRGKRKHNHVLVCAYKAPDFCLEGDAFKVNSDGELLEKLRALNDELAVHHGLTIVRDPDIYQSRSWYEEKESESETSWKKRAQEKLLYCRDRSQNWYEFLELIGERGYTVREGTHLVYRTPEGKEITAEKLGETYTKESLRGHWLLVKTLKDLIEDFARSRPPEPLRSLMDRYGTLYVRVPIGIPKPGRQHTCRLSLKKPHHKKEALESYFDPLRWYEIEDAAGNLVTQMTGHYVMDYLEAIRRDELPVWATNVPPSPRARKKDEDYWYVGPGFQKDEGKERYRVCWYNEDGTRRSLLEVMLRMTMVIILGDRVYRRTLKPSDKPLYLISQEWELQPVMDALGVLKAESARDVGDLSVRCTEARAQLLEINELLDPLCRGRLSKAQEDSLLRQRSGLKKRIVKLERAMKYLQMSDEEIREEYVPKVTKIQITPDHRNADLSRLTAENLNEIIRWASVRADAQEKKGYSAKDHRER